MSQQRVYVTDLTKMAMIASKAKRDALVTNYYDAILAAAKQGEFNITIYLAYDAHGACSSDEVSAIQLTEQLFPGIELSFDVHNYSYTFAWNRKVKQK